MKPNEWVKPSWKEYLLALASTGLLGYQFQLHQSFKRPQSAGSYYSQEPFIMPLHFLGMTLFAVMVLCTILWLVFLERAAVWATILKVAAALGVVSIWMELALAKQYSNSETSVYILERLPFVPIHGAGIIGSSALLIYLVLSSGGREKSFGMLAMKLGLAVCFAVSQKVLWDVFAG